MKKILSKKIFIFSILLMFTFSSPISVFAASHETNPSYVSSDSEISPYKSNIKYVYRHHKGKLQYRRYNMDTHKWVDSKWRDVK